MAPQTETWLMISSMTYLAYRFSSAALSRSISTPSFVIRYLILPSDTTSPSATRSLMYSEIAWGVTPSLSATSFCRTFGWLAAISTRI